MIAFVIAILFSFSPDNDNPFKYFAIKTFEEEFNLTDTSIPNKLAIKNKEFYREISELKDCSEKTLDLLAWNAVYEFVSSLTRGWDKGFLFAVKIIEDSLIQKRDSIIFSNAYSRGWLSGYNTGYSLGLNRMQSNYDVLLLQSLLNAMPRRYDIYLQLPQQLRIDFYYHPHRWFETKGIYDVFR